MTKRKTKEQTTHDRKVGKIATQLENEGYSVQASHGRRPSPEPLESSGRISDIVAKKNGKTRIIEVETPRSMKKDTAQLETFARYAAKKRRVSFDIVLTKPRTKSSRPTKPSTRTIKKNELHL